MGDGSRRGSGNLYTCSSSGLTLRAVLPAPFSLSVLFLLVHSQATLKITLIKFKTHRLYRISWKPPEPTCQGHTPGNGAGGGQSLPQAGLGLRDAQHPRLGQVLEHACRQGKQ